MTRFLLAMVLVVVLALIDGGLLWAMWRWFIVPLGVKAVGFWHAVGLDLMVSVVTFRYHHGKEDPWPSVILSSLIAKALMLGLAALVLLLMR